MQIKILFPLVLTRELENLQAKLHTEVVHQLAATDSLMKENIGKLVESKVLFVGIKLQILGNIREFLILHDSFYLLPDLS